MDEEEEEATEPRRTDAATSSTLGRRRFVSCNSSVLVRGVVVDGTALLFVARLPDADFHDLRIDFLTLLFPDGSGNGKDCVVTGVGGAVGGRVGCIGYGDSWSNWN